MKKTVAYSLLILCGSLLSLSIFYYGKYQLEIGKAVESFLVFEVDGAEDLLDVAQGHVDYGRKVPLFGNFITGPDTKKAEVDYWQKEYQNLTGLNIADSDVEPAVEFIRANSFYRQIESERDRAKVINGLESAIVGYVQTINKDEYNFDAAFNYEYLVRVLKDVADKKKPLPLKDEKPAGKQGIHGQEGQLAKDSGASTIKIHIPFDSDERKDENEGQDAGKGAVKRGKG